MKRATSDSPTLGESTLYIPHGSDETFLSRTEPRLPMYFISHMVQMKLGFLF